MCLVTSVACGHAGEAPTTPPTTSPADPGDVPTTPRPPTKRAEGFVSLIMNMAGGGTLWSEFYREPQPRAVRPEGCRLDDDGNAAEETRTQSSAGRVQVSTTSGSEPILFDNHWNAQRATYMMDEAAKLRPESLGPLHFVAEGSEVPPFEADLEPVRSLVITSPLHGAPLADDDLVVGWEADDAAVGGVDVRVGGASTIRCGFGSGVRTITVPREMIRAALARRRADLRIEPEVMVFLARGQNVRAGDFDVSVSTALMDTRVLVAPK